MNIVLRDILETLRHTGVVAQAAGDLARRHERCSEPYIRKQLSKAGLTLAQVLAAPDIEDLLE